MTWDWNAELTLSRALVLQVSPEGALLAVSSISRAHLHLVPDSMLVLLSFAGGVPAHEALGRLQERYQVDRDAFAVAAQQLIDAGFIVPSHGQQAAAPATGFFADALNHVAMLADGARVDAYRTAIQRNVRGKTVLELGCGTGLLSLLCAQYGARSVVAVEESSIADVAAAHFAGHEDVITLVRRSSRDVTLREPVEVIVHELIGGDPLAEGLLPSICDARRRLRRCPRSARPRPTAARRCHAPAGWRRCGPRTADAGRSRWPRARARRRPARRSRSAARPVASGRRRRRWPPRGGRRCC